MKNNYLSILLLASLSCVASDEIVTSQFEGYTEAQNLNNEPIQFAAIGSGFNYQGELLDTGTAVNGNFDFSFQLYDAVIGGIQIGSNIIKGNRAVTGGIFSIEDIDFGNASYTGDALWLSVTVRETGNPGSETTLSPRQKIHAVPYAVQSEFGATPWTEIGSNVSYNGTVGINGTTLANADLFIDSSTGRSPIVARINGIPKLNINTNGGTTLGFLFEVPPVDGLLVKGRTVIRDTTDATLSDGSGALVIGDDAGNNLTLDGNEILAKDNGTASTLFIGADGGGLISSSANGLLSIGNNSGNHIAIDGDDIQAQAGDTNLAARLYLNFFGGDVEIASPSSQVNMRGNVNIQEKLIASDSGNNSDMKAYVYGRAFSTGALVGAQSSDGFTVSKTSTGLYRVTFTDTTINTNYIVVATTNSSSPKFTTVVIGTDAFDVHVWTSGGIHSDHSFQFVVYRK